MTALAQAQALREACEWEAHAEVVRVLRRRRWNRDYMRRWRRDHAAEIEADAHERGLLLRLLREAGR